MQSNKLKSDESKRKNTIAKFARVKKTAKLMLMNVNLCPDEKPTDPKLLALWQENLLKLGKQAENNTCIHFGDKIPYEKFNVSTVLTSSGTCKQMQLDLRSPGNTPAEELQFFNTTLT